MNNFTETQLKSIVVHQVGNKSLDERLVISEDKLLLINSINELLITYFLSPFKSQEYFNFFHANNIEMNEVYVYASKIFQNPSTLHEESTHLAKYLYEKSIHPKIKGGEFYTAYFTNCNVDGETVEAIGLFKSENKEDFLKVSNSGARFEIESEKGININKLDKGCLIFNTEKENGYVVSIVDQTNKGAEAQYWIDDFLHIRRRKDEYHHTESLLSFCKSFVTKEMPDKFEISKADQVDFLNKSVKFFKENDNFNMAEFESEVVYQPAIIEVFKNYKNDFKSQNDLDFDDNFVISEAAVKKQARIMKSIIKLDKNFHIYIHGNRELIEQGIDENGRKFYKIYYKEEK